MSLFTRLLSDLDSYQEIKNAVSSARLPAMVIGLSAVHKAQWALALAEETGRQIVLLTGEEAEAHRLCEDVNAMAGGERAVLYPVRDLQFRQTAGASGEYEQQRLKVLAKLSAGDCPIVCTSAAAAAQYTMPPARLKEASFTLSPGDCITPEQLIKKLLHSGYTRRTRVTGQAQFALRGGIVDFFPPASADPIRAEFWGDEIDTLSAFDLDTQRRTETLPSVGIAPAREILFDTPTALADGIKGLIAGLPAASPAHPILRQELSTAEAGLPLQTDKFLPLAYPKPATLLDYCENPLVIQSERADAKRALDGADRLFKEDAKILLEEGVLSAGLTEYRLECEAFYRRIDRCDTLFFDTFARSGVTGLALCKQVTALAHSGFGGSLSLLEEDLSGLLSEGYRCVMLAGEPKAARILANDLQNAGLPALYSELPAKLPAGQITVTTGSLSGGFTYPDNKTALFTTLRAANKQRRPRKRRKGEEIRSLSDLQPGDLVVHTAHGIGRFDGIQKLDLHGVVKDYIKIRYAGADVLYLPVTQLDLVSKYIGPREEGQKKLNKLNSGEWNRTRRTVRQAVAEMADELIRLYAERMQQKGYAFSPDSEWQREFEEYFPYEETDDQLTATEEIKRDMEKDTPMERLLCGDVGFGKTEVAFRAAFKAILDGKQVAMLCPTTILAWQHYQNAVERFSHFPVNVELLSRFRTPKQQKEILRRLKRGEIDLIIGTHRLVQKDVAFRDLGLAIVDEEQRFGVAHKERFKEMFRAVDMLHLSATPIPRTLNMAMSGIRDISLLEDPPLDRFPVQTYVIEYDPAVLADAIRRELRRDGQVYYIHNRIESIELCAARLRQTLPDARIAVAHGKMSEEISAVWQKMVEHEVDVLVCTTLIETGVDVPNCNTLIIEDADRMGLSQLYQLRGRVGRSGRRAFAFFTFRPGRALSDVAARRLNTIREFTQFGSGFRIALRDLEIRGAGNILGARQHGHMEAVGYDMYLRLLTDAIAEQQGKTPPPKNAECLIDIRLEAHIPESYIADLPTRLDVYRKIASVTTEPESMDLLDELIDRFGEPPKSVQGLIDVALLRNTAARAGFTEITQRGDTLILTADSLPMAAAEKLIRGMEKGQVQLGAGDKSYVAVSIRSPDTPLDTLRRAMKCIRTDTP